MLPMNRILCSLVICLLLKNVISQESPEFAEEYIDEELPESAADPNDPSAKAANETSETPNKKATAKFADDRFTQLFQPRPRNQQKASSFFPKFASKPKPTLPPFIKKTPPIIKAAPVTQTPTQNQRLNQNLNPRTSTTTQRTTTRTPSRGNNNAGNRRNQLNNNNNNNNNRGTTSTTSAPTTESAGRRRFGGSNRRLSANGTIPATTSRPRRF